MSKREGFVEAFTEALVKGDSTYLAENVIDKVRWNIVGGASIQGKEAFLEAVEKRKSGAELSIITVISHGTDVAVNGTVGNLAFSHIFKLSGFKDAKVSQITSYLLDSKG